MSAPSWSVQVPPAGAGPSARPEDVDRVLGLVAGRRFLALTGAGLSTDSGIPDYRGPGAPVRQPMTYQEFVAGPAAQQRYWARSHLGWSRMRRAEPNAGHHALTRLEAAGLVPLLVTQNVDGLHEAAGSRSVCALHGRIADVVCLGCGDRTSRAALHARLAEANPGWGERHAGVQVRPDGDVDLDETAGFVVPACEGCGGVLKPDVVLFGENVPRPRVERCYAAVDALDPATEPLVVLGSSLSVMSGFRFVRRAVARGVTVVVVTRGPTRADPLTGTGLVHTLHHGTTEFLTALEQLARSTTGRRQRSRSEPLR